MNGNAAKRAYPSDDEAVQLIVTIGHRMYQRGFVSANDGNITVRVADNALWATPTGVSKEDLTPQNLIKIDLDGNVLEGTWKPTSETLMHTACYKANDALVSTAHCHSPYALLCAIAGVSLDVAYGSEPVAVIGKVPVAPYALPGTDALAQSVVPFVKDYRGCLLANHGALTWGEKPIEAWYRMEALESYAQLCLLMETMVGRARKLSEAQVQEILRVQKPAGANALNTLAGAAQETNTSPPAPLSEASGVRAENGLGARLSATEMDRLADLVAARVLAALRNNGG